MRLVILSNRLRVIVKQIDNTIDLQPASGGLATGLESYLASLKEKNYLWIGWPGSSAFSDLVMIQKLLFEKYNSSPVFVESSAMETFYQGFCNKTIWPLFHYFPYLTVYDEALWQNYKEINEVFAKAVLDAVVPGDVVWIHDYHFMLVPKLIKAKRPEISVGFFLHIPFPSYELFRLLPKRWGKEILEGLLDADLIGFHTHEYTQYFLRCVLRISGINHNMGIITMEHKLTKVDTFPMGIDYEKFRAASLSDSVKKEKDLLKKELKKLKVILSVDRQDYTKGILNRLQGYELFLKNNPQWRDKLVLIMIVVPSRIGVEEYQKINNEINQLIGKINGDYGNIHWTPVIYQYRPIPFEQLLALYSMSHVGLVTPLRDGMNLVAKEYIASQDEKKGVLILSEMAGAAMELGEAVIINPNNREEIAEAIKTALEMTPNEQALRISAMQEFVKKYNVKKWAEDFLSELNRINELQLKYLTIPLDSEHLELFYQKFNDAKNKIIFLDYDGTIVPFAKSPAAAVPDWKVNKIIKKFMRGTDINIVIISGRDRKSLQRWFGKYNLTLVAEHGVWIKSPKKEWEILKPLNNAWKPGIKKILETYKDRLPGSFIEEKDYSIVWHFRNSDPLRSDLRVKEFVDSIDQFTSQNEIQVLMGNKVVEIKCTGINKGEAAKKILLNQNYDFIMAAGDDDTDELLFQNLPAEAFTIKIGKEKSYAKFSLVSSFALVEILEKMASSYKNILQKIISLLKY